MYTLQPNGMNRNKTKYCAFTVPSKLTYMLILTGAQGLFAHSVFSCLGNRKRKCAGYTVRISFITNLFDMFLAEINV
jgi:hypothetical protein